jgi:hypothetical protein
MKIVSLDAAGVDASEHGASIGFIASTDTSAAEGLRGGMRALLAAGTRRQSITRPLFSRSAL